MSIRRRRAVNTRVVTITEEIRAMAYSHGPRAKLPTVQELIVHFGAGQSTIVSALDELEAQNILYRKDRQGIFVSPKIHRKAISILIDLQWFDAGSSPFWGILWGLFGKEAEKRSRIHEEDYQFHVAARQNSDEPLPESLSQGIRSGIVDGVISIGLGGVVSTAITQSNTPHVAFAGGGDWRVHLDGVQAVTLGVSALASLGCRRIAKLGNFTPDSAHTDNPLMEAQSRERFFAQLEANGLSPDDSLVLNYVPGSPEEAVVGYQQQGIALAMDLFNGGNRAKLDGLLIVDDMLASGVLAGLRKCGVRPGQDIRIATNSNAGSPILFESQDLVTFIEFDPSDLVNLMFATLDDLMHGRTPAANDQFVWPRLRDSTTAALELHPHLDSIPPLQDLSVLNA